MTSYWGPRAWKLLHCVTYNYPENPSIQQKQNYSYFFNYIVPSVLPCPKCQKHFLASLRNYPINNHLQNKRSLTIWLINTHNNVNIRNKKKNIFS